MSDSLLCRVRQATCDGWRAQAAVHPGGEVAEIDGLLCHTTAIPVALWNGVHVERMPGDPVPALRASMAWFAERGLQYAVLVPVELEPALAPACGQVGLELGKVQRQMAVTAAQFSRAAVPPEQRVTEAADSAAVVALAQECFGDPPAEAERFVAPYLTHPDWTMLLGSVAGESVATATLMRQPGAAGIFGVATTAAHRRRGYGAALTSIALERRFAELSDSPEPFAHLNPSEDAVGMYARMGFRPLPGWAIWTQPSR